MKQIIKLRKRWMGMLDTIWRFPLTILLFAAATISNAMSLANRASLSFDKLQISFLLGALLSAVFQLIYERFFIKPVARYLFYGATALVTLLYYLCIRNAGWSTEIIVRTSVILFILGIAFLWVPVIQSRYNFNDSFMAAFKGFFMSLLFHGVMFLGVALILGATNQLLFQVDSKAYLHSANILFVFFAPFYFLSMIPYYPGKKALTSGMEEKQPPAKAYGEAADHMNGENLLQKEATKEKGISAITPGRFLEALISYAMIPITAVFTIILLIYIIMNITGEFWSNSLMEPLLVAYSITVIIVYILASTIDNVVARNFRRIFPKVLIPVVLFQTVASILKIRDVGITYGRYYVILFGIFATIAGIIFCIKPVRKNGVIAPILIVLSLISVLPVTGAFTVSKSVQIARLENTLRRNDMLNGERIIPNSKLSERDRNTIISSVEYLGRMDYVKEIGWLADYRTNYDFEKTFGFPMYSDTQKDPETYLSITRDRNLAIPIQGYDFITSMYDDNDEQISYTLKEDTYTLRNDSIPEDRVIILEKNGNEINRIEMSRIYAKLVEGSSEDETRTTQELTFSSNNEISTLTVVIDYLFGYKKSNRIDGSAQLYVFVDIK